MLLLCHLFPIRGAPLPPQPSMHDSNLRCASLTVLGLAMTVWSCSGRARTRAHVRVCACVCMGGRVSVCRP